MSKKKSIYKKWYDAPKDDEGIIAYPIKKRQKKSKGWRNEPQRHGLASKGIQTTTSRAIKTAEELEEYKPDIMMGDKEYNEKLKELESQVEDFYEELADYYDVKEKVRVQLDPYIDRAGAGDVLTKENPYLIAYLKPAECENLKTLLHEFKHLIQADKEIHSDYDESYDYMQDEAVEFGESEYSKWKDYYDRTDIEKLGRELFEIKSSERMYEKMKEMIKKKGDKE